MKARQFLKHSVEGPFKYFSSFFILEPPYSLIQRKKEELSGASIVGVPPGKQNKTKTKQKFRGKK